MKWNKFQEMMYRHPFLVDDLNSVGIVKKGKEIKEFVRTRVGFIAFRPFEKLDLASKTVSNGERLPSDYVYAKLERFTRVDYDLMFHHEGEPEGSRGRNVFSDKGDGSIQAHIDDVTKQFETLEHYRGKQLIWDRVIKRTLHGSSHMPAKIDLEIYLFPQGYRLKPMPRIPVPPIDPGHLAWMNYEPCPPAFFKTN